MSPAHLTVAAGLGGALGASARALLTDLTAATGFPWMTLAINVVGSALLAGLPAVAVVRRSRWLPVFLGTGALGGFTTNDALERDWSVGAAMDELVDVGVAARIDRLRRALPQDFAAIGVIGMTPYKYDVEATAYIGQGGQTSARLQASYEALFTGRLILQSLVEVNLFGQNDPRRGIGSGLSTLETGYRLRYEFTRRFAPYIGIVQ